MNANAPVLNKPLRRKKISAASFLFNALIVAVSLIFLFPLVWIFVTSMKSQIDVLKRPLDLIPSKFMFTANMKEVLRRAPWDKFYLNTITVAFTVLAAQMCISIPAAYAFAYFKFKGKGFFYLFVLSRLLVSPESLLLPNYLTITNLNLYNTAAGLGRLFPS